MRLFRPERIRLERSINLTYTADGPIGTLQAHFLHYSFNKGFNAWVDKHNRYSWLEAEETLKSLGSGIRWRDLVSTDPVRWRRALKELSCRLPCRPLMRFLYMYGFRLGFLDGGAGLTYCRLLAMYEYMIVVKMREIQRRARGLSL
jgi:hypothetical protein